VHNDVRSPNVFLLQTKSSQSQVAKLADFGLARIAAGGLKMGLDSWQWLAPEVLDTRRAATYTVQADVFSLGIVCWEVVNGPGIHIPYVEYEKQFKNITDIKKAIRENGLRPSMSGYAVESFGSDPRFEQLTSLMNRCLASSPSDRPRAEEAAYELALILGIPADKPPARHVRPAELRLIRELSFDVSLIPRPQKWVCSSCNHENAHGEPRCQGQQQQGQRACERERPSLRVMCMGGAASGVWLGLKSGAVAQVRGAVYAFPKESPVMGLCCSGDTEVWAATGTHLLHIDVLRQHSTLSQLDASKGTVVGLVNHSGCAWLLQSATTTTASIYRGSEMTGTLNIPISVRVAAEAGNLLGLAGENCVLVYEDGRMKQRIDYGKRLQAIALWLNDQVVCVASSSEVLEYRIANRELVHHRVSEANVRSVWGSWIGSIDGLHSREGRVCGGEISCLWGADGVLWVLDNTHRLLCAYA
jgi:hypothetical protein